MNETYGICTRCVMDTSDPDITFDINGVCNHCRNHDRVVRKTFLRDEERERKFQQIIDKIKNEGRYKNYDCIMGLSGGVDSSYMAYLAKQFGLRPFVIHVDNGWNAEIAGENIRNIVSTLDFKLHTYSIDWEEFKDLQRSFLKASVIDIEMITDHAIAAIQIREARRRNIKYILGGSNVATESGIPKSWSWLKSDLANIKAIQKKFGTKKITSIPTYGTWKILLNRYVTKRFEFVYLLDAVNYNKTNAMEVLSSELGWQYYGGKHYESVFTKFYQAYILPEKFGVDKRRAHLSSLIRNNETTREESLRELETPSYHPEDLRRDKELVLKRLGFSDKEFDEIMKRPIKSHMSYLYDLMPIYPLLVLLKMIKKYRTELV
jgi:N-acetyl sugar amidotransferase